MTPVYGKSVFVLLVATFTLSGCTQLEPYHTELEQAGTPFKDCAPEKTIRFPKHVARKSLSVRDLAINLSSMSPATICILLNSMIRVGRMPRQNTVMPAIR